MSYLYDCKTRALEIQTVQKTVIGVSLNATLANPKSQTLSLQLAFANIFFGLRSRWYTFAASKQQRRIRKLSTYFELFFLFPPPVVY